MTVGIVGLGLIGGSMAKAIKANTDARVLGQARSRETVDAALSAGAIDEELTQKALKECDLVLLALPLKALLAWLRENASHLRGTVIDLCGVKREIWAAAGPLARQYGFTFVGGHPMAGKEVGGFANATAQLYQGASMILVPGEDTDPAVVERLHQFFLGLGFGTITYATAQEHDRIIAYTSQLAHIASSAYIKSPTAQQRMGFSAGSFRDMTRVAKLDADMWTELFMANKDYLVAEVKQLLAHLNEYLAVLEEGDAQRLRDLLQEGRKLKISAGGK